MDFEVVDYDGTEIYGKGGNVPAFFDSVASVIRSLSRLLRVF